MKTLTKITLIILVSSLIYIPTINSKELLPATLELNIRKSGGEFLINSKGIGSVNVGMSVSELLGLGLEYSENFEYIEGDKFHTYDINLTDEIQLTALIHWGGIYKVTTFSNKISDSFGLGVGSTLADLKIAYPDGRVVHGFYGEKVANFLTGTTLIYSFDSLSLPEACFVSGGACEICDNIRVQSLYIVADEVK